MRTKRAASRPGTAWRASSVERNSHFLTLLRGPSRTRPRPEMGFPAPVSQIAASSVSLASRALVIPGSTNWFESVKFIESVCGHFFGLRYAIPPGRDQPVFAYHDSQAPFAPPCDARRTFQRILSWPFRFNPEAGCDLGEVSPHSKSPGHAMHPGCSTRKS